MEERAGEAAAVRRSAARAWSRDAPLLRERACSARAARIPPARRASTGAAPAPKEMAAAGARAGGSGGGAADDAADDAGANGSA
jgi:hypothetical protein